MPTDPGFNQLHLIVCMMIELRNYALTDKSKAIFELCKNKLLSKVEDFPTATAVIDQYASINGPHDMPAALAKCNYSDTLVDDVNGILGVIFQEETPEQMIESFDRLADLTAE